MLKKDFYKYQAQTTPFSSGFEVDYAKGSYIYGKNGKKYLDFVAGVSANTLGHSHPAVIEKITEQLQKHMHVMVYGEYAQEMPVKVCKKLAEILPAPLEVTYLVNSGAEAIDGALKLAKRVTGRSKIVSAKNSYHGNTHGALSVSGNESFKQAFRPLLPDVHFIEFNDFEGLEKIDKHTAAVILESIQGAAGFISSQNQWLKKVREKCDETGTLLILDEIQPGFGRTGKWFAFMHEEIVPDILCMGKGMASGLPIGAFTASTAHMKTLEKNPKLGHITTFGGNPVIAAAALATLEQVEELNLMSEIFEKESLFRELLIHPKIKSFRGRGLMIGLELESEVLVQKVAAKAMEKGLILFWLLYETHILRITPPLTISLGEIREGCEILLNCLEEV